MIDRRCAIRFALAAAVLPSAWLSLSSAAHAEKAFQHFIPFLIDLPGWKGEKPDGMSMEMPGTSMITATREYERGTANLSAQITIGAAAQGALAATHSNMKIETSEGHVITSTIDGLPVTRTYTNKDKSGTILVALADNAMFSLSFKDISEDEALRLAKTFKWKQIQAVLPK